MTRRSMTASFAPGAYVFPGGGIDAADAQAHSIVTRRPTQSDLHLTQAIAAIRESYEELGVLLDNLLGELPATERDLRQILKQDSDNVAALNSLGYILADSTQRYSEAYELLEKALRLKPDDAAIIDSMGWLYYRTGKYPEALDYLRQAYEASPNAEIGAHLGEVLWTKGNQREAKQIWGKFLKDQPDSTILRSTIKRLTGSETL